MASSGDTPSFTVIQFSLETGADNRPTQRSTNCGSFVSVEEAFLSARCLANDKWNALKESGAFGSPTIIDTEWGYDLRLGPLTVHRFWVHENFSSQRLLK
ncbi:MAG: hypothetical protein C0518_07805 [Opitutus sp.]|nr:hypothetical protein [Opitutus sp.]